MKYGVVALMFLANSEIISLIALIIMGIMFLYDIKGAFK